MFAVRKLKVLMIHLTEMSIFVSNKTVDFGTKVTPIKFNFHVSVITTTRVVRTFYLSYGKVKVKCTLVQALRLCTGRTAHRWSRGIALLFHDHGTRRE